MNLFIFPAKFVYWKSVKNHKSIKNQYYPKIIDKLNKEKQTFLSQVENKWDCSCYSNFFEKNGTVIFDQHFIDHVIWSVFDEMLEDLSNSILNFPIPKKSHIKKIWYNYYEKGMFQEVHNHTGFFCGTSHFSGVYLMDLNENNTTIFTDIEPIQTYPNLNYFKTEHVNEGNVIIFPSKLMHYVNPCLNNRLTVSFNIFSEY
jgi:hypothetical protein